MCGFFVLKSNRISLTDQTKLVNQSLQQMSHRGPDNLSQFSLDDYTFGHVRLSIQDLSSDANQPFVSRCGRFVLCFNGEIYNSNYLRGLLQDHGFLFKTQNSDTEVLLYWLIKYGTSRLDDLDGEWSFSFFDSISSTLILCRDRVGTKPLYFFKDHNTLIASSELKSIVLTNLCAIDISPVGLESYLVNGATVAPYTLIKDIYKVGPGQIVCFSGDSFKISSWWSHDDLPTNTSSNISFDKCRSLVIESVVSRTISDVPFGVLFSGGVDSSIIASTISFQTSNKCNTFTVGFDPPPAFDESKKAKYFSNLFKSSHHELTVNKIRGLTEIRSLIRNYDVPLSDWVNLPLYLIAQKARQDGFPVLIAGEGADELFLGYSVYFRYIILDFLCFFVIPFYRLFKNFKVFSNFARKLLPKLLFRFSSIMDCYDLYRTTFISNSLVFYPHDLIGASSKFMVDPSTYKSSSSTFTRIRFSEFKIRLPELLLMRVDSMSMLNSVETRVPFLSASLLNSILPLGVRKLSPLFRPKYFLKRAFSDLPSSILWSRKTGFGTPVPDWFTGDFKSYLLDQIEFLNDKYVFFQKSWLHDLISKSDSSILLIRNKSVWQLWTIFVLLTWYESVNVLLDANQ